MLCYADKQGIKITTLSIVVFLIYCIAFAVYNKNHTVKNIYPEGKELIKLWHHQEIEVENEIEREVVEVKKSILDDEISITNIDSNSFVGGFVVNTDILEDDQK